MISLTTCLILVLSFVTYSSLAQNNDFIYFPETDHTVQGEFLDKFNSVTNPIQVFGFPITEEIWAPDGSPFAGKRVQYFQRAIFEYRVENAPGHRVQLVPLGTKMIDLAQFSNLDVLPANHPACEDFPGSDFRVCYAFLQFFKNNGGVSVFGYPITDLVVENNRIIQYFEFARFEWRPELAQGQRVHLTNLGEIYFNANENSDIKNFIPNIGIQQIQALRVQAFPLHAVISNQGTQTIYIIVKDQLDKPVSGAEVSLRIVLTDEEVYSLPMNRTDENGLTSVSFAHQGEPVGRVQILVEVTYNNQLTKISRMSYRIW
jgi:hypothetical protein